MTSRRIPIGWLLLLATALLAGVVFFGVPTRFHLDSAELKHQPEYSYVLRLPELEWPLVVAADGLEARGASTAKLLEDGRPLGPAHVSHGSIRRKGRGRYSHWQGRLLFSASDNSDPRANGRRYVVVLRVQLVPQMLAVWFLLLGAVGVALGGRWFYRGVLGPADVFFPIGWWAVAALSYAAVARVEGTALWMILGIGVLALIWAIGTSRRAFLKATGKQWQGLRMAQNATLTVASMTVVLAGAEALLTFWESRAMKSGATAAQAVTRGEDAVAPEPEPDVAPLARALESFGVEVPHQVLHMAARREALITLPPELDRQPLEVEGAARAFNWQGVLHVKDRNSMRRAAPFPPRQEHVFRVMVVGDSLTYGDGIDERWTYSRQLESLLASDHDVEVLNLGIDGHQSRDIVDEVREFLPRLRPDLVIYGVCLNDFLPSGVGQYANNYAYAMPFPESVTTFFTDNFRLARLSEDAYNRALLALGLRVDFFGDILDGFSGYQQRFAVDVVEMNELVTAFGLPPVVTLVLDQYPAVGSDGYRIAQTAEKLLKSAGMDLIDMAPYFHSFDRFNFRVSRWEGHPNEVANSIWAALLNRHLSALPVFESCGGDRRESEITADPGPPKEGG